MTNLSAALKKVREEAGVSQNELARRADVSVGFISKMEAGQYGTLSLDMCQQLAQGLGVTLKHLLSALGFLEDEKTKNVSLMLRTALRESGFSSEKTEKVVEYATLLRKSGNR